MSDAPEEPRLPQTPNQPAMPWAPVVSAVFAFLLVVFLMGLIIASIWGLTVPDSSRFLIFFVVAFCSALAFGFVGGYASANGSIPLPGGNKPIQVSIIGGFAAFVITLLICNLLFSGSSGKTPLQTPNPTSIPSHPTTFQPTSLPSPGKSEIHSLSNLRDCVSTRNLFEHVSDNETVLITAYPTAFTINIMPKSEPLVNGNISIGWGESADIMFHDKVYALGVNFSQGLYPTIFVVYYNDGSSELFQGKTYYPETEFIGVCSEKAIDRLIIQTQAQGDMEVKNFYFFSEREHERHFPKQ